MLGVWVLSGVVEVTLKRSDLPHEEGMLNLGTK